MAVAEAFGDIIKFIKGKGPDGVRIDNKLFQLHYRLTTFIFLASSAMLCTSSLFGSPVTCHHADPDRISNDVINTYCWITTTYTLPQLLDKSDQYPHSDIAYHGIGGAQASAFYLPHWLWKLVEGRRLSSLLQEMQLPVMDPEERRTRLANLVQYLAQTLGSYNGYFFRFVLCELLNVATGGPGASPMTEVFPKLTKCNFQLVGGSGSVESIDSICVMALNILNEKIYLLLWFWLVLLAAASVLAFAWRCARGSPNVHDLEDLVESVRLGDFFLLSLLARNMDLVAFRQLVTDLGACRDPRSGSEGEQGHGPVGWGR
ncbi:innexin inx2-like [Pollicipes pollicipes]|uniref:innexin inx2-like n=1 Tax=Pollicipes pollicipes TaxID=41117 RepID=UPI0018851F10|nr:innexin inx2-like [Pollicipes pollicipes]